MAPRLLPLLLLLLLAGPPAVRPAPPTCYSRMLSLSREITGDFQSLQAAEPSEPCVRSLPGLHLDIHNYCVLAKLRDFVASPQCRRLAQVDALKDKVRKLYTIMNSFCRRDLVFLSDDCSALEHPVPRARSCRVVQAEATEKPRGPSPTSRPPARTRSPRGSLRL